MVNFLNLIWPSRTLQTPDCKFIAPLFHVFDFLLFINRFDNIVFLSSRFLFSMFCVVLLFFAFDINLFYIYYTLSVDALDVVYLSGYFFFVILFHQFGELMIY